MFRIKICGVTRPDQVAPIREAGADAIGLNFYSGSRRCLARDAAENMVAEAGSDLVKVGVFVNSSAQFVGEVFDELRLDLIQLHGDEPPEMLAELDARPVMKAFRLGHDGMRPVVKFLDACRVLQVVPRMVLLDAHVPGEYGGSGTVADWQRITTEKSLLGGMPLILAGGLTSSNVAAAITTVQPFGVDTASGVETAPGIKDLAKVRSFCSAARTAFS